MQRLQQTVAGDVELLENLLVGGGQNDMLHRDVLVLKPLGLVLGLREELLQPRRDINLIGSTASRHPRQLVELLFQPGVDRLQLYARLQQDRSRKPAVLLDQREQKMFDIHLLLPATDCLGLRGANALLELFSKTIEVHNRVDL